MESTIIIPAYNNKELLERCLDSLMNQTYRNFKIVLVDDGSPQDILTEGRYDSKYLTYVRKENAGAGLARDYGLSFLDDDTRFVFFIDSDDCVDSDYLEHMVGLMKKDNLDFCQCSAVYEQGEESSVYPYPDSDAVLTGDDINGFLLEMFGSMPDKGDVQKMSVSLWAGCFLADIIKNAGLHFESERRVLSEDTLFKIDYLRHCRRIGLTAYHGYRYRVSDNSLTHKVYKEKNKIINTFYEELKARMDEVQHSSDDIMRVYRKILMYFNNDIFSACGSEMPDKEKLEKIKDIIKHPLYKKCVNGLPLTRLNLKNFAFTLLAKLELAYLLMKAGEIHAK